MEKADELIKLRKDIDNMHNCAMRILSEYNEDDTIIVNKKFIKNIEKTLKNAKYIFRRIWILELPKAEKENPK